MIENKEEPLWKKNDGNDDNNKNKKEEPSEKLIIIEEKEGFLKSHVKEIIIIEMVKLPTLNTHITTRAEQSSDMQKSNKHHIHLVICWAMCVWLRWADASKRK